MIFISSRHTSIWPGPGVAGRRRLNDCASSWRCFLGRVVSLAAVLTFRSAWLFFTLCLRFSLLYVVHGIFYKLIFVLVMIMKISEWDQEQFALILCLCLSDNLDFWQVCRLGSRAVYLHDSQKNNIISLITAYIIYII